MNEKEIKDFVKNRYSKIATKTDISCSCCGGNDGIFEQARKMGYSEKEIQSIPEDAILDWDVVIPLL
jgi:arsenite methyltransferase